MFHSHRVKTKFFSDVGCFFDLFFWFILWCFRFCFHFCLVWTGPLTDHGKYWNSFCDVSTSFVYVVWRNCCLCRRQGFVDPQDGYTQSFTWTLPKGDVGYWYIFIQTDIYRQVHLYASSWVVFDEDNVSRSYNNSDRDWMNSWCFALIKVWYCHQRIFLYQALYFAFILLWPQTSYNR